MMEFYASFFMVSTLVFQFLWLRERSKRKYAELDRTSVELYWRNEEARVAEKLLELEAEYNELLAEKQSEGEWKPYKDYYTERQIGWIRSKCSSVSYDLSNGDTDFCPNCGAKMKGGAE